MVFGQLLIDVCSKQPLGSRRIPSTPVNRSPTTLGNADSFTRRDPFTKSLMLSVNLLSLSLPDKAVLTGNPCDLILISFVNASLNPQALKETSRFPGAVPKS